MSFQDDTRAASIPITHALTIAITALLLAGLLLGAGGFIDRQQDRVARGQLAAVGGDVLDLVHGLDRLNATGETVRATIEPTYPRTVAGSPYTVSLVTAATGATPDTRATLYLNSSAVSQPIRLTVVTDTPVLQSAAVGERPTVVLCHDGGAHRLALGECP